MATKTEDTPEYGYWPKRDSGVVERRRRPVSGTWTEIDRMDGKHSVRCQHRSEPKDNEFGSIGKALPAAKDPTTWCRQCAQAAQLVGQAKAAKLASTATSDEKPKAAAKPKTKRRSGKANGPRVSDGKRRAVKTRTDETAQERRVSRSRSAPEGALEPV